MSSRPGYEHNVPSGNFRSASYRLKVSAAKVFEETRQSILLHMVKGCMIHADETSINLHGKSAYVWVFATFREVAYFYADTREGDILQKLLSGFNGVLVSDFYTAYDSFPCPQQKCLIHLMRDLNDTLLDHPYDGEVKEIVTGFAELLKNVVQTIGRHGLKRHFLESMLSRSSDSTEKCCERLGTTTMLSTPSKPSRDCDMQLKDCQHQEVSRNTSSSS